MARRPSYTYAFLSLKRGITQPVQVQRDARNRLVVLADLDDYVNPIVPNVTNVTRRLTKRQRAKCELAWERR